VEGPKEMKDVLIHCGELYPRCR